MLPAAAAACCRHGGRLRDRLLLRCERRVAGFFRTGAFVFAKRHGWRIVWRLAAGIMHLVRLWLCIFAAVDVVSWLFADPRRFRGQRFSVRLYGGCFFALRLHTCVCAVVCCGWFARRVSRAGAVFAWRALRADVCASAGAAAWPAVSCCDGALFPGTGVGVLPAACGCGHGELCRAVFHKAYSVTDGHSG